MSVVLVDQPEPVLDLAGGPLISRPVVDNLILSLLADRTVSPQPGRYLGGHRRPVDDNTEERARR